MYSFDNRDIHMVDYRKLGLTLEEKVQMPYFIKGQKYSLKGVACDGFDMPSKTYELVGVVEEHGGVPIQSVIMKQVDGSQDVIFTLSKHDCETLGITYEKGLQLWPKSMNWEVVKDDPPFDENDMSTLPRSENDNTIRYAVIRIDGFRMHNSDYLLTPNDKLVHASQLSSRLNLTLKAPLWHDGFCTYQKGEPFKLWSLINPMTSNRYSQQGFLSSDGGLYMILQFLLKAQKAETIDGYVGIEPRYLEGMRITDLYDILFDDHGLLTVKEMEEEQERKRKKAEEEQERKRKEREAQQRAEKMRANEAISRMATASYRWVMNDVGKRRLWDHAPTKMNIFDVMSNFPSLDDEWDLYISCLRNSIENLQKQADKLSQATIWKPWTERNS